MSRPSEAPGLPCHHELVPLLKIKNPRTQLASQFVVLVVTMFLIDLMVSDDSVASALLLSVSTGIVASACLWWLTRRSRN